jgi:anti-sigma factor RsiW
MDCFEARKILTQDVLGQAPSAPYDLTAAQAHVAGCPACAERFAALGRAVLSPQAEALSCAECRAWLPDAADGALAGNLASLVTTHLAECPACAAEHAALRATLRLARANALPEPPRYPAFDLSFLPSPAALWTQVRAHLRRLTMEVPAALLWQARQLVAPPPGLRLSYAPARVRGEGEAPSRLTPRNGGDLPSRLTPQNGGRDGKSGRDGASRLVATISISDEAAGLRIDLRATRSPEGTASLAVSPVDAASEQPLAGTRVALAEASGRLLETATVRAEGVARFAAVAPGHYLIRVQRQGNTWEIPVWLGDDARQ